MGCTPQPLRFGAATNNTRSPPNSQLRAPPKRTRMRPPNPSRFGAALQKDKDGTPPNPSRLGVASQKDKDRTPQPFTICSDSRKGQGWDPRTLHDLAAVPFPESNKFGRLQGRGLHLPTLHEKERFPKDTDRTLPTLHDLAAVPFTASQLVFCHLTSTASQKAHCFFRHPPGQPHGKPNPERDRHSPKAHMHGFLSHHNSLQHSLTESPLLFPAPARTADTRTRHRKPTCSAACLITTPASTVPKSHCFFRQPPGQLIEAHMRTRQHSLTESPTQKGTNSQKAPHAALLSILLGLR